VQSPKLKEKRSAPSVAKIAGVVVGIAPNGEPALPADSDVWLPAPKIRKLLGGISPVTFWRWRHNPQLGFPPGRRVNGRWYFQWAQISEWHAKQAEAA
jgi:hypothetical protein